MMEASSETSPERSGHPPRPTLPTDTSDSMARQACSTASRLFEFSPTKYGQPAAFAFCPKLQVLRIRGTDIIRL